jgi:hypothetical protein
LRQITADYVIRNIGNSLWRLNPCCDCVHRRIQSAPTGLF